VTTEEALDLALEALEYTTTMSKFLLNKDADVGPMLKAEKAITAIKQARALDKKAENARELGLDYEPAGGTQVSKVWWDGEKLMAKPIPLVEFYKAAPTAQPSPVQEPVAIDGNTSDGYHTFNDLYEFRKAYNAALFNEWAAGGKCSVHKSWRHHNNELCFGGGWFIVVAVLPQGQISNHYEAKDWDLFAVPEVERVLFEFDGHTGADVVERLKTYTTPPTEQPAPVHEPVAWMKEGWGPDCGPYIEFYRDDEMGWRDRKEWTPLYTAPPNVATPPSDEIQRLSALVRAQQITIDKLEVALVQEPVECMCGICKLGQRQWVELTDEEIKTVIAKIDPNEHYLPNALRQLSLALEAKLKENWHQAAMCNALGRVVLAKSRRLIINVPPRSGKTELAVINFIARSVPFSMARCFAQKARAWIKSSGASHLPRTMSRITALPSLVLPQHSKTE